MNHNDTLQSLYTESEKYACEIARLEKELSTARAALKVLRRTLEQLETITKEESPLDSEAKREGLEQDGEGALRSGAGE